MKAGSLLYLTIFLEKKMNNITELNLNEVTIVVGGYSYSSSYLKSWTNSKLTMFFVRLGVASVGLYIGVTKLHAVTADIDGGRAVNNKDLFIGAAAVLTGGGAAFRLITN